MWRRFQTGSKMRMLLCGLSRHLRSRSTGGRTESGAGRQLPDSVRQRQQQPGSHVCGQGRGGVLTGPAVSLSKLSVALAERSPRQSMPQRRQPRVCGVLFVGGLAFAPGGIAGYPTFRLGRVVLNELTGIGKGEPQCLWGRTAITLSATSLSPEISHGREIGVACKPPLAIGFFAQKRESGPRPSADRLRVPSANPAGKRYGRPFRPSS